MYLLRTDSSGNLLWSRTFGGPEEDRLNGIQVAADGSIYLYGWTASYGEGMKDATLIKTDDEGEIEWATQLGGTQNEEIFSLTEEPSGEFTFAGFSESGGMGKADAWIGRISSTGIPLGSKTIGGIEDEYAHSIIKTNSDKYLLAGWTESSGAGSKLSLIHISEPTRPY